jgi:hypothetical protein
MLLRAPLWPLTRFSCLKGTYLLCLLAMLVGDFRPVVGIALTLAASLPFTYRGAIEIVSPPHSVGVENVSS